MPPLRIGKLARLANVNVQTIRFYERTGLLAKPQRRPSGYREYSHETVGLVRMIKHVQGLAFSLKEIKAFIALSKKPSATMEATCGQLEDKINELDARIRELTAVRATIVQLLEHHRQRAGIPFAPAFDKHVQKLASEALAADDHPKPHRNHTAGRPKKTRKSAAGS